MKGKGKEKEGRVINGAIMTQGKTGETQEISQRKTQKESQVQATLQAVHPQAVLHQAVPAKSLLITDAIKKPNSLKETIGKR
jgi:hypothetical protein